MSRKVMTIPERVDALLKEGVENPKKWASVHGYVTPDNKGLEETTKWWADEWMRLRVHHLEETNFLFRMLDEMRRRLNEKGQ